jgi:hypothetical protein
VSTSAFGDGVAAAADRLMIHWDPRINRGRSTSASAFGSDVSLAARSQGMVSCPVGIDMIQLK